VRYKLHHFGLAGKLAGGDTIAGTWIQRGSPAVVLMLAPLFDFLVIDQEHTPVSADKVGAMLAAGMGNVLVRLAQPDYYEAKRYLDMGAAGVIAPMVDTVEAAQSICNACRYPPRGRRGLGYCRANRYGRDIDTARQDGIAVIQIETLAGMNALGEIVTAQPRPDGIIIGPYDLAQSAGYKVDSPELRAAARRIIEVCAEAGVPAGLHIPRPDRTAVDEILTQGARIVAHGTDIEWMLCGIKTEGGCA